MKKEHRPRSRKLLAVRAAYWATVLAVSLSCGWVWFFLMVEREKTPLYDQLNANVLAQLPPPPPARLIESRRSGNKRAGEIGAVHGRTLSLEYELTEAYDVRAYYKRLFELNGWEKSRLAESDDWLKYYRGTSCVIFTDWRSTYSLEIWHDFANQSFSPVPPPYWLLNIAELNGTIFRTCPGAWAGEP